MKCPSCASEIVAGSKFCHHCGATLAGLSTAAAAAPTSTVAPSPPKPRIPMPMGSGVGDEAEEVLWQGQFSKLAMIGEWIAAGVATIAVIVIGAVVNFTSQTWGFTVVGIVVVWAALVLRLLYQQLSLHYYLTNQRFIHERGLLWREVDRIEAIDIDDVAVTQGPVERMLGIGSVRLRTSDASSPEFTIKGIEDVRRVASLIDDARRKERRKRGVYVESV
jgi:membrane protein YdbS with pleckstrin-like domain